MMRRLVFRTHSETKLYRIAQFFYVIAFFLFHHSIVIIILSREMYSQLLNWKNNRFKER